MFDYAPLVPYPGCSARWKAICTLCGVQVELVWNQVRHGSRPRCACTARRVSETRKSANSSTARSRMLEANWEPLDSYPGTRQPWRSRCLLCGEIGQPILHNVAKARGCRTCSGWGPITEGGARKVMLAAGWRPLAPYPGPRSPWLCECVNCGRRRTPWYEVVKSRRSGCRDCVARIRGERRRQIFASTAIAVMRAAQLDPLEPYPGANKQWLCRCLRCGDITRPRYGNVHSGSRGCETCRRRAQGVAKRDRYAEECERLLREMGYTPQEPYPGMAEPWSCLCRCGRPTRVWAGALSGAPHGCRWCADYGFSLARPGLVYLIFHPSLLALKVGVTGVGSTRVATFERHGWQVLMQENFDTGFKAAFVEKRILSWWRDELKLAPYLSEQQMPIGGWSETVGAGAVSAQVTVTRMQILAEQVRSQH